MQILRTTHGSTTVSVKMMTEEGIQAAVKYWPFFDGKTTQLLAMWPDGTAATFEQRPAAEALRRAYFHALMLRELFQPDFDGDAQMGAVAQ